MKSNGLTLIELVVVIALIALLSIIGYSRIKDQIAKAKDVKAISVLSTLRLSSELYYATKQLPILSGRSEEEALNETLIKVDDNIKKLFDNGPDGNMNGIWNIGELSIEVGGHRASKEATLLFNGEIDYTFTDPNTSTTGDGISIWMKPRSGTGEYDTLKNRWDSY